MIFRPPVWVLAVAAVVFFAALAVLLFAPAMSDGINHDEQQFIAAGQLFATHGLLPYRDFPYFHMPIKVFVDAMIFSQTDYVYLAARASSAFYGWLSVLVIFGLGYASLSSQSPRRRILIPLAVSALLVVSPIFSGNYFRAWNQSLALLLALLAIACHFFGARKAQAWWFGISGVLVTLAIGTRLTYAPLGLPFLLMAWFIPEASVAQRVRCLALFIAGMVVGFIPSLVAIAQAPVAFFFDNFSYNGSVTAAFRGGDQNFFRMGWSKFVSFLRQLIQPSTLLVVAALVYLTLPFGRPARQPRYLLRLVLGLLPFALVGALTATPPREQYYTPVIAFCMVGILAGFSALQAEARIFKRGLIVVGVGLVVGTISVIRDYSYLSELTHPKEWSTLENHAMGLRVKALVPKGKILTLGPMIAIEGGFDIYPSLATGPFAWRVAHILTPEQRTNYKFVGPGEFEAMIAADPPVSIFTGFEKKYEPPLIDYATKHGYRKEQLSNDRVLWIPPAAD